jgi:hypothetical protein
MAIAEIIDQIDTYLSRLHEAREILSHVGTRHPHINTPTRNKTPRIGSKKGAVPKKRAVARRGAQISHDPLDASSTKASAPKAFLRTGAEGPSPASASAVGKPAQSETVVIKRLPARHRFKSVRSARTGVRAVDANLSRPAIALAQPTSKILVISAAQVRLERERAAQSAGVTKRRADASSRVGKSAFESLFNDGAN